MRNSSRRAGYASRIDRHCPPKTTAIISAAIALAILMTTVGEAAAQSDTTSFVTTWRTTAVNDIITLPIHGTNMAISWGDGTTTTGASGPTDHTYGTPGSHTISVSGGLTRININGHADAPKLISIDQWGNSSWTNMRDAFRGASNMVYNAIDAPDLSKVTNMLNMFNGASSFNGNITNWDTSSVIDISSMFHGATVFNQPLDWDTSKVIGMREVFSGATAFNGNIADWDTSKVDRTSAMFSGASSFNGNITNWDTSRVTHMIRMFDGATAFNQPLDWNTSEVVDMSSMFKSASSFNGNITDWDTSKVTNMNRMFGRATAFNQPLDWNTSEVTSMSRMFSGASSFNGNITNWDTSKVTDMNLMFFFASSFNQPLSTWNVSSVTSMNSMFNLAIAFNQPLDWDTSKVTGMSTMFHGASSFNGTITDWDTSKVTSMSEMFSGASSFNQPLDWDTSKVTSMSRMFSGASSFNGTITDWDTSKVTRMDYMFNGASSFNGTITDWDTSKVTRMNNMFAGASSFNGTITDWDTSKVTHMNNMFAGASSFDQPLGSWDVSSALDMNDMFNGADAFDQNLGAWYIMLDSTAIDRTVIPGTVGEISSQNRFLSNQRPAYDPVSNIDSARFDIDSNLLKMTSITPAKATYIANITATGPNVFESDNNWRAFNVTVNGDVVLPAPTLSTTATSPTNAASVTVTVDFGEAINAATFDLSDDVAVTGGTASSLSHQSGNQIFTFTITPSADGQVTASIPAGSVTDPAGNGNTASNVLRVTSDRTAPGPTLSTDADSPTNSASITVTVDFGEAVNAATFTLDDISVTGGDASGLAQEGATTQKYTFTVTPSSDGQLTVTIPADSVKDPAGNNNTASGQLPVTFDRTTHVPALSTDAASPTNAASVTVAVDFGEPIDDATFTLDDISVTGGDASGLAQEGVTTQKYTFTVTPSSDGQLTVTIPADSVKDPAGNSNTVSNVLRVTFDRTTHVPALSTDAASPTNAASVTVAVDFGEPIDDATFTLDDISVTGGDASGLAQEGVTTQKYTFTVTPSSDGQLTVTIPADSVKDPAGNSNTASNPLSVTFDRVAFSPALSTSAASPTNSASATITVDFGEPIDDATFTLDDISVTGGDASGLAQEGATTQKYTFTVTPSSDGQLTVTIPADSVKDPAGNNNTASGQLPVTFDRTTHVPALSTDAASPTNAASVTVAVDFGEPIDDATFTLDDISVTGGDASGLAQEGVTTQKYTFTVTPSSDGQLTVTIPADSVKDPAGNSNTVSNVLRVTFDRTTHVPALSTDAASPTNAASVTVAVDFGEPIDDATFTLDDISVTGGDASGLAQEGVTTQKYTFTVTPSSDGQLTVTIPADSVKDPAGNSNTVSNVLRVTFDRTTHVPALSTDAASPTNAASVTVAVDFGEPIDDATFTLDDISVTGGDASGLAQEGATTQKYTFTVTPSSDGQLTVTIPADSVKDPAGNNNTASGQLPVTFDRTTPGPTLSTDAASPTNAASVTVAVDFGEPIDDATFTLDDISVTGGDASGLAQEGVTTQKYTFTVTPSSDGQLTVTIPADSVKDPAGNSNTASGQLPVTFDRTSPAPSLATDTPSLTNATSVTVDFGEAIDASTFAISDVSVTGGNATSLAHSSANQTFTFTLMPDGDGEGDVTAVIPAGSVTDPAGNDNTASNILSVTLKPNVGCLEYVSYPNNPPVVDVGGSITVAEGETGTLRATVTDMDGDDVETIWFHWSLDNAIITIADPESLVTEFTAPYVDSDTVTYATLYACDGIHTGVGNDVVRITITDIPEPPEPPTPPQLPPPVQEPAYNESPSADAGAGFTINEGATGQLQGTATDPDNDPLTMEWYQTPTWPLLTLTNASDPRTTIVAPQVDGDTTITLILSVSDGDYTVTDQVRITITGIPESLESSESTTPPQLPPPVQESAYNEPPSANAGADFTINEGATGQLQGTATDPDNGPLTIEWYQTPTWPLLTLTNASDPRTTIVAPQVDGDTTITLILSVSDGDYTVTDQVRITITDIPEPPEPSESTTPPQLPPPVQEPAYNEPPSADAGTDFTINEGATGQLQGTATDLDNGPLTIEWYQTPTWPPLTLTNASDPRTTIVAPQVDGDTTIMLILSVSDGDYTVNDRVQITIIDTG